MATATTPAPIETDDTDLSAGQHIFLSPHPWPDVDLEVCYQLDDETGRWHEVLSVLPADEDGFIRVAVEFDGDVTWVLIEGWAWTRQGRS